MAKQYKVWVEIEEYDTETEQDTDVTGSTRLDNYSSAYIGDTLADAEAVAMAMLEMGRASLPATRP